MGHFWESVLLDWREQGRSTLRELLLQACTGKKSSMEQAIICDCFSADRPLAIDGDKVELKRHPDVPKPSPDIYLFQNEDASPVGVVECKYGIGLNPATSQTPVSTLCRKISETARKFDTARVLIQEESLERIGPDFVVMTESVAPVFKSNWMHYLLGKQGSESHPHYATIRVVDTRELRDALERLDVRL